MPFIPHHRLVRTTAVTLAAGAAGGALFAALGFPGAWLSGAMMAVAAAAMGRVEVAVPQPVRVVAFFTLAAVLGSGVSPETLASVPEWPLSLALLAATVATLLVVVPRYLARVHGFEPRTALLCAVPGALSFVVAMAAEMRLDVRRVAVVQTVRLAILMVLIPAAVGLVGTVEPGGAPAAAKAPLAVPDVGLVLLLCLPAVPAAKLLRLPAAVFTGPMLASAGMFALGLFEGAMPDLLFQPAMVATGAAIGARFAGTGARFLGQSLAAGAGATAIGLLVSGVFAAPASWLLEIPFAQVWLAFAPGGFEAMTILAFALDLDPAFVAGHQLLRFLGIAAALPLVVKLAKGRGGGPPD